MTNAVIESILSRRTTKYYDPAVTLSDDQIRELVRIGTTAPTSFHLQNWRFIAVRTPEAKARLRPIAWNQPAVTDAAVTFIVCGQLADSSVIPKRLTPVVEAGIMPAKVVPDWENPARGLYFEHPQRQRDEAVRTGAIGATAMIYAARSLGLGSTPMIGFDAEAVHREFGLADDEVPVMLLSIGAERPGNWPQKPRRRWPRCWISSKARRALRYGRVPTRAMTGGAAAALGPAHRGLLREGQAADVVLFDPATIIDRSTYDEPHQYPAGIGAVIVNGTVVSGEHTGALPGRLLRRRGTVLV